MGTPDVTVLGQVQAWPGADSQAGIHSTQWDKSSDRLIKGHTYRDLGVVCIIPTRTANDFERFGSPKFQNAFDSLIKPPNHPFALWRVSGCEVGDAYNRAIWMALNSPEIMKWNNGTGPILFTVEDDQILAPDTLIRLLGTFKRTPYAGLSALYWTKGEGGVPQIWGSVKDAPPSFAPQVPVAGTVQECRGIGMGAALWDIAQFQDVRTRQGMGADGVPIWFKTWQELSPTGPKVATQDLSYCEQAQRCGYRFAVEVDTRVGHMDSDGNVW